MTQGLNRWLRNIAAIIMIGSGLLHIATLWLFGINSTSLFSAGFGAVYLITGLGLLGHSRLALVVAIIAPSMGIALFLSRVSADEISLTQEVIMGLEMLAVACCMIVLVRTRNLPSV